MLLFPSFATAYLTVTTPASPTVFVTTSAISTKYSPECNHLSLAFHPRLHQPHLRARPPNSNTLPEILPRARPPDKKIKTLRLIESHRKYVPHIFTKTYKKPISSTSKIPPYTLCTTGTKWTSNSFRFSFLPEKLPPLLRQNKLQSSLTIVCLTTLQHTIVPTVRTFQLRSPTYPFSSSIMVASTRSGGTKIDFTKFDVVSVTFSKHSTVDDLHVLWTSLFGLDFPFDELLDKTNPSDHQLRKDAVKFIHDKIIAKIKHEVTPDHTDAADLPNIDTIVYSLKVTHHSKFLANHRKQINNDDEFDFCLRRIDRKLKTGDLVDFEVQLNLSKLFTDVRTTFKWLNFAHYSTKAFPVAVSASPATQSTTAAPSNPGPQVPYTHLQTCMTQMGTQFNQLVSALNNNSTSKIEHICNHTIFDSVLSERHLLRNTPHQFLRKSDVAPITIGNTLARHEIDSSHPASSFMALSGDYFILQDLGPASEKNLRLTVTKYTGNTAYDFYKWYEVITIHIKRFNKYIHPYYCFRGDCDDPKGFTIGDGPNDAVPLRHKTIIEKDSKLLWDVLNHVFEKSSREHTAVQIHNGCGYTVLHTLVADSHPQIVQEPSDLILHRPTQDSLSLLEYMCKYEHYLMLKTFIEDHHASLDNDVEKQHFVSGCKYSNFIKEQIRRERDIPAHQHKFTTSALIITITGYLNLPNSPTKRGLLRQRNSYSPRNATSQRASNIHSLQTYPTDDEYSYSQDIEDDENVKYAYNVACNKIRAHTDAITKPCLVCTILTGVPPTDNHRFEQCPVLLNHDLLKNQVKGFCGLIMRGRNHDNSTPVKRTHAVSAFATDNIDVNNSHHGNTPTTDFHLGHS